MHDKIHNNENRRNFGSFIFTDSFNEENFGQINLNKIGLVKVNVYANEGPVPHLHIESTDKKFECCVQIYRAKYFSHGTKTNTLTNQQAKDLNNFLKSKFKPRPDFTVWEAIDFYWKAFNDPEQAKYHDYTNTQPDYTKLNL